MGLEGRAGLVSRLGDVLAADAAGHGGEARPGRLYDLLTAGGTRTQLSATELLGAVLRLLSPIFTSGSRVQGLPAGDVWPHRWAGAATGSGNDPTTGGWVPFHKLSQWMSYSLLARTWKAGDEFIVEWRALTVTLLDELATLVRQRLGKTAEELPLACILEGGTWAAGRELAAELRGDGAPPLRIDSDGTVF